MAQVDRAAVSKNNGSKVFSLEPLFLLPKLLPKCRFGPSAVMLNS